MDNPFITPSDGEADWDSSLNANIFVSDRGYHFTERAGVAINTGQIIWLNSGGFAFPFDPNSTSIIPHGLAYTAAASGDSATFLAWGIVRSLGINSVAIPGKGLYVSALTPGLLVTSPNGPKVGRGLTGYGVMFNPDISPPLGGTLGGLSDVNTTGVGDGKVLTWADASSRWVPTVPVTGRTQVGSMSDVDRTGLADGSILKWSDASSKFVMSVDSAGGGGTSDGSPPTFVQFAWNGSLDSATFGSAPTSGNMIVAMLWNTLGTGANTVAGWSSKATNGSGTDFKSISTKIAGASETAAQTPSLNHTNNGGVLMWELSAPVGHVVTYLAGTIGTEQTATSNIPANLPNMTDVLGLAGTAWLTTISAYYNYGTSDLFDNTGNRKLAAGHSKPSNGALAGIFAIGASGNNKASTALVAVI